MDNLPVKSGRICLTLEQPCISDVFKKHPNNAILFDDALCPMESLGIIFQLLFFVSTASCQYRVADTHLKPRFDMLPSDSLIADYLQPSRHTHALTEKVDRHLDLWVASIFRREWKRAKCRSSRREAAFGRPTWRNKRVLVSLSLLIRPKMDDLTIVIGLIDSNFDIIVDRAHALFGRDIGRWCGQSGIGRACARVALARGRWG